MGDIGHDRALAIAKGFIDLIAPTVGRVEITGALRRGVARVEAFELLATPLGEENLFQGLNPATADSVARLKAASLAATGVLTQAGWQFERRSNYLCDYGGIELRFMVVRDRGVQLKLQLVNGGQWGVAMMQRTGSARFAISVGHWASASTRFRIGAIGSEQAGWLLSAGAYVGVFEEDTLLRMIGFQRVPEPEKRTGRVYNHQTGELTLLGEACGLRAVAEKAA